MESLKQRYGYSVEVVERLKEALCLIEARTSNIISFRSKERKQQVIKILHDYNLTYVDRNTRTHSVVMGPSCCKQFREIVEPIVMIYQQALENEYTSVLNSILDRYSPTFQDMRQSHLFLKLDKLKDALEGRDKVIFYDTQGKTKKKITTSSSYFLLVLVLLKEIYRAVHHNRLIHLPTVAKRHGFTKSEFQYVYRTIDWFLEYKPVYFNCIRHDMNSEENILKLPKVVQNVTAQFEVELREFLRVTLLKHANNAIRSYFPEEIIDDLINRAKIDMEESQQPIDCIAELHDPTLSSPEALKWVFQQMAFWQYRKYIQFNYGAIYSNYFPRRWGRDLNRINSFRIIIAHHKVLSRKDEIAISQHLARIFRYLHIFRGSC